MPVLRPVLVAAVIAGCGTASPVASAPPVSSSGVPVLGTASGYTPDGSLVQLSLVGDRIDHVEAGTSKTTWVWPPIVDSHVHLAYYPVGAKLVEHGIAAVVDLAAPEASLTAPQAIRVIAAGPMITRPGGYPLNSWGANGYGIGCDDFACITATIDRLAGEGAKIIKLPLDVGGLPRDFVAATIDYIHSKGLKAAVHALSNEAAYRGGIAGADILAHTPVEPVDDATINAWKGRVVITTLAAFGGQPSALTNLRKLRAAGMTVLYGTDLGNVQIDGPSADEVKLMRDAGMDDTDIVAAMTTTPIAYWALPLTLKVGDEATFLVLDKDPRTDATVLLSPHTVIYRGRSVR